MDDADLTTKLADQIKNLSPDASRVLYAELLTRPTNRVDETAALPLKTRWLMRELADQCFPAVQYILKNVIPAVGFGLLAARPKAGKSWLCFWLAKCVGSGGGEVLGLKTLAGKVLYFALEDNPRRLKERAEKIKIPRDANIVFFTEWRPLLDGGLVDLENELDREDYALVIIDTLSRMLGRADQMDLAEMTTVLGALQRIALNRGIAILAVDHQRKTAGFQPSPIDDILGSTGKSAVADFILGMYREPGKKTTTLKVIGRDLEERELALDFDPIACEWLNLGDADDVRENTRKADILRAIRDLNEDGEIATTSRIARHLSLDRGQVSRLLGDLGAAGKVWKLPKVGKEQPYGVIP